MEETAIVLMLKEQETGFLTKELGCYTVVGNPALLYQIYAEETEHGIVVHMGLTCEKETQDCEYEAIFDYYETEALAEWTEQVVEEEGHWNPVWFAMFPFLQEEEEMKRPMEDILQAHALELQSAYEAIVDKKDDYCE